MNNLIVKVNMLQQFIDISSKNFNYYCMAVVKESGIMGQLVNCKNELMPRRTWDFKNRRDFHKKLEYSS